MISLSEKTKKLIAKANDTRRMYIDLCKELNRHPAYNAEYHRVYTLASRASSDRYSARREALEAIAADAKAGLE